LALAAGELGVAAQALMTRHHGDCSTIAVISLSGS
jgi:hypothetical protein